MKSLWISRCFLCLFIIFLFSGISYTNNNLWIISALTKTSQQNQAEILIEKINSKYKYKHLIEWQLNAKPPVRIPQKIKIKTNNNIKKIIISSSLSGELTLKLPISLAKSNHNEEALIIENFYSKILSNNKHIKKYYELTNNYFSPLQKNYSKIFNKTIHYPLVSGILADYFNEENYTLSGSTHKSNDTHAQGIRTIKSFYYYSYLMLYLTSFFFFLLLILLLTRRSFITPLLVEMDKAKIPINESSNLIWRMTPYLLFPGKSFQQICQSICIRYKTSLEKKISKKEFQIFKEQSIKLATNIKSKCDNSGIKAYAHQFCQIPSGSYSQQQFQDRLFQLKRIEKSIEFITSQFSSEISFKDQQKVWELALLQLHNFKKELFKAAIQKLFKSIEKSNSKVLSSVSTPTQKQIKAPEISSATQIAEAKAENKESLLNSLRKQLKQKYYYQLEIVSLKELEIVSDLIQFLSISKVERFLQQNLKELLSNNDFLIAAKTRNIHKIDSILKGNVQDRLPKNEDTEKDLTFLPLKDKRILMAGGDKDQIQNYTESLKKLGALDVKIILENTNQSRSTIQGKYDIYIYIATRISHSLRFQISNLTKKNGGELIVLNLHRSAFFEELKGKLQYW
ncbi:MAG: hypothetical protein COA79_13240 [Planctomycetota bacterium]|nr:MAG: hypothetical protein COA79_13240 [Planctomycetota bacterium]